MAKNEAEKKWEKPGLFTIGFKLNLIVSLILIFFLMGVTYIATYFFQYDSIRRIQEVVSDKSQTFSLKLSKDLDVLQSKSRFLTFTLLEEKTGDLYRKQLWQHEKEIFYVALVEKKSDSFTIKDSAQNEGLIEKVFSSPPQFALILQEEKHFAKDIFASTLSVNNLTQYFSSPVLMLSFPKGSQSEQAIVVLFSMNAFLEGLNSYSEYITYIVNNKGELVGHPDRNLLSANVDFSQNEIVHSMLTSSIDNRQMTYRDENATEQIGSFSKIELGNMAVISTVNKDTALEAVYQLRRRNYLITFSALMISMMAIYFLAKTLTTPVKKLVSASRQVSEGDYKLSLTPQSRDEIGTLTYSFINMAGGLEERERMKETFGKFVNKEIAEMASKGEIKLGGERKQVAIFFSDIRSFTSISETLQPEQVVEFLNEYMTAMVECVNQTHGVVDKYIGDAIMATWGTPFSHGNDTENAVNAALLMRQALIEFNRGRGSAEKPIIRIGCGINTGVVLAGQIGSVTRMEYTVIGDAVNLASRVESLNKPFGTDILITDASYKFVKDIFNVEPMKRIMVKGKKDPQRILAVLGRKDNPNSPRSVAEVRELLGITSVGNLKQVSARTK